MPNALAEDNNFIGYAALVELVLELQKRIVDLENKLAELESWINIPTQGS